MSRYAEGTKFGSVSYGRNVAEIFSGSNEISNLKLNRRTEMSDNDNGVSGFGWFLAGLGLGALVGVLYAPKSGRETRDDLVAGALEAKDRAAVLAQEGKERAAAYAEQGKQQVGEYVDRGKEYYDRGRTQWSQYVDKGKGLVQEQQDKVSAAIDAGKDAYASTTSENQA
jgi:gas vesicle protein